MLRFNNVLYWPVYAMVLAVLIAGGNAVWSPIVYVATAGAALQAVVIALTLWDVFESNDTRPLVRESGKSITGAELRVQKVWHIGAAALAYGLVGAAMWRAFA